ncbi:MAG: hypothetical protein DHS20C13_22100 [Thermodesulfobacteriota bacterium]|nr:MAG: hypothetical protein DHS20C13_22100 [Thermodesulfobacteriota bacterium]GJM35907.1 MAG: hypothetical protein DHS20C18_49080 [Saprospiraceae bacterium]
MSIAKNIINQNTAVLELIKETEPDGTLAYFYVLFTADVFEIVKEKLGKEKVDFSEYGIIIHHGTGEPDEDSERLALEKLKDLKK